MLLADLVATSATVSATRSRKAKVAALAGLLRALEPREVAVAVGLLTGVPRQGRIGVGWRSAYGADVTAAVDPSIQVMDLDAVLTALGGTGGSGSQAARRDQLEDLFSRATQPEVDFIRRLLTGELRQGALAGVMTDAIATAAEVPIGIVRRAAMLSGDLGRTGEVALAEGHEALATVGLEVLRPVQPMLAASAGDVGEALAHTGRASVEWKLDGIRVQVHRAGADVRIYTRNLNDITERLPQVVEVVRGFVAEAVVLDGEVLGVDEDAGPKAFQDTMSAVGREGGLASASGLGVTFFDVLHLDGVDLIDEPLVGRIAQLDALVGPYSVTRGVTDDPREAQAVLDRALAAGHEGVVVKALESTYDAGRRGGSWRKVKPVHTVDLVVLAAEWGHGRREGWLSNLHLGARGSDGALVMVGKTFKGLTDELLTWQTEALLAREVAREGITVVVRPELVVEIALDGVQTSTRYPGGVALRFARVKGYRPDKDPADADTIDTVRSLRPGVA